MSSRRKLKEEEGQTKLKGLIKVDSPSWSVKQRTPPSMEKPESKRINMLNKQETEHTDSTMQVPLSSTPTPIQPINPIAFDLAAMEQRLIASYQDSIKTEVNNALKPLQESIDILLASKEKN